MKKAFKVGFGVALGLYTFDLCKTLVNSVVERCFRKKFDTDLEFRLTVKEISPELYVKYRKENKEVKPD